MTRSGHIAEVRAEFGSGRLLQPAVGVVLTDEQDRLLLLRHHDGDLWGTPGGAVEPGERPADAAVREMWEETGLHVVPTAVIGVFGGPRHELTYDNGDITAYVSIAFAVRLVGGILELDDTEVSGHRWVDDATRQELPMSALTTDILDAAFARISDPSAPAAFEPPVWTPTPD